MTFIYFLSDDDPLKIAEAATVAMVTSSANVNLPSGNLLLTIYFIKANLTNNNNRMIILIDKINTYTTSLYKDQRSKFEPFIVPRVVQCNQLCCFKPIYSRRTAMYEYL